VPPRGVKKGTKRARQYEHIKESEKDRGVSTGRAKEIAARTVNKQRAQSGEARSSSASSRSRSRSSSSGSRGRTREQLYAEARRRNIRGRSKMNKAQLQRALR
jgi:hypothetical protein